MGDFLHHQDRCFPTSSYPLHLNALTPSRKAVFHIRAQPFSGDSVALDVPPFLTPGLSGLSAAKLHFLTYPACNFLFCCPLKEVSNKFILFLSIFISVKLTCVKIYWQPVYPFQRVPACPFSVCLDVPCSLPKLCRVFRSLLCVLQRKGIKRKHTISFS